MTVYICIVWRRYRPLLAGRWQRGRLCSGGRARMVTVWLMRGGWMAPPWRGSTMLPSPHPAAPPRPADHRSPPRESSSDQRRHGSGRPPSPQDRSGCASHHSRPNQTASRQGSVIVRFTSRTLPFKMQKSGAEITHFWFKSPKYHPKDEKITPMLTCTMP